jgi:hypothetical protein
MKHQLSYTLGIIVLGLLGAVSGPADSATTAAGPYYATPSWDQTLPSTTRFIVLSNFASAAVLDRETGLVWEKVPSTALSSDWFGAYNHCVTLNLGGRKGWRLPTIQELASLVDPSQVSPALPSGHPFTVPSYPSAYWSATTIAFDTVSAWLVAFNEGDGVVGASPKSNASGSPWCVRGGSAVDPL